MKRVRAEFRLRALDVISCVRHVEGLVVLGPGRGVAHERSARAARALRAACYVMTYNMVESAARSAIEAVFEHLRNTSVSFDLVRHELKLMILQHARKQQAATLVTSLTSISTDIFAAAFDPKSLFSGNVDAKKLRHLAKQVGYSVARPTKGDALLTVKNHRNDLAHGVKAFSELGRDVTVEDLRHHVAQTIVHMRAMIAGVDAYLVNSRYLA